MCDAATLPAHPGAFLPMSHVPAFLLATMSLLSLFGCSQTTSDLPASLSDLRVEISVEDFTERGEGANPYHRRSCSVVLYNARGKALERDDVRVEVNGVSLPFRVGVGNYYDRHPYYKLSDDPRLPLAPGTEHRFVLILPDGRRHAMGVIRLPAALQLAQIDFPRVRPATGGVAIAWRDLAESASLTLFRSDRFRESDNVIVHEAGSANDPAALRKEIGPRWFRGGSGRWEVPAGYLADRGNRALSMLGAELRVTREGQLAGGFAKGSTLRAERRLALRMDAVEQP